MDRRRQFSRRFVFMCLIFGGFPDRAAAEGFRRAVSFTTQLLSGLYESGEEAFEVQFTPVTYSPPIVLVERAMPLLRKQSTDKVCALAECFGGQLLYPTQKRSRR
jgi:hypothetical protein